MDYAKMRRQVAACWYDTQMADAFRAAFNVSAPIRKLEERDADTERRERYWRKMMGGRLGAMDRG